MYIQVPDPVHLDLDRNGSDNTHGHKAVTCCCANGLYRLSEITISVDFKVSRTRVMYMMLKQGMFVLTEEICKVLFWYQHWLNAGNSILSMIIECTSHFTKILPLVLFKMGLTQKVERNNFFQIVGETGANIFFPGFHGRTVPQMSRRKCQPCKGHTGARYIPHLPHPNSIWILLKLQTYSTLRTGHLSVIMWLLLSCGWYSLKGH